MECHQLRETLGFEISFLEAIKIFLLLQNARYEALKAESRGDEAVVRVLNSQFS